MTGKYDIVFETTEQRTRFTRTKNKKWCFTAPGINDYLWLLFDTETEAVNHIPECVMEVSGNFYVQKV